MTNYPELFGIFFDRLTIQFYTVTVSHCLILNTSLSFSSFNFRNPSCPLPLPLPLLLLLLYSTLLYSTSTRLYSALPPLYLTQVPTGHNGLWANGTVT